MATAEGLHGHRPSHGRKGGRRIPDVVHEFRREERASFGGKYLELVPNERIVHTDEFDDPNLPGTMIVTVTLKKSLVRYGTQHRSSRRARRDPA
jgi:uncharacterized protein YndB with AHSA1/START domain